MRARTLMVGLGGAAYVLASHWLMTRAPASEWNAVVVVGPMLALLMLYAWQHRQRLLGGAATIGLLALFWLGWRGSGVAPQTLYVTQHVAIHAALAAVFAVTLRPGREPLITALARRVHGRLTPDMVTYSRKVTLVWAIYFVAMGATSIALFVLAPFNLWATFANFGTPVSMTLLFIGEHVLRYRLHPEFERATLGAALRAYSRRDAAPVDTTR
ncbi:MAG: hypothetical protein M3R22_08440 [Pseudomonadota bacterium]|nr:hypothetical protein [Pseudomonadota bacterium]